jgi:LysR family transcriptional regulator, cell division regulator
MIENLTDLKYFMEVARTGNITRASERLGVTQPSLTLALQRLEHKMGITLLERTRQGTFLTRSGEELYKRGGRMLQEWEREFRLISQGQESPVGRYSLGVHTAVAQYTLDLFIPELLQKFSELEFSFQHDLSRKIQERIISRECDLALVINPLPHPDLVMQKLLTDEVTLFGHLHYQGDVLILDPALKQSQTLLKKISKAFPYQRELYSSSLEVIRHLAESKAGVAILPTRVATISNKLKVWEGAPTYKDELYLVYRMERKSENSFKELVSTIRNVFRT